MTKKETASVTSTINLIVVDSAKLPLNVMSGLKRMRYWHRGAQDEKEV